MTGIQWVHLQAVALVVVGLKKMATHRISLCLWNSSAVMLVCHYIQLCIGQSCITWTTIQISFQGEFNRAL